MSQGNDFANYASSLEDRSSASEDVWFVAVSSDDIKQMTVDQLDEAFRLGVITAQTAVWTEGMEAWAPLGEVADLDSSEETSGEVEAVQHHFSEPQFSEPGFSEPQFSEPGFSERPAHSGWNNPFEAPASAAPSAGFSRAREETMQSAVHNSIGPTSFAPVTSSFAPSFAPGSGSLGHSTGPVALNVDEDMPAVHRGRRVRPERWLLAAAGVIAVAVIGFNNKDLFSSSVATTEKQASAAALIARPYEAPAEKGDSKGSGATAAGATAAGSTAPAAVKSAPVDDGDAPIGSLKGETAEEENGEAEGSATEAVTKPSAFNSRDTGARVSSLKDSASKDKDSVRGGMAKAFAKGASATKASKAEKPSKASKAAKAKLARKAPASRATKGKKGVPRAASAFDPLNGSLP